MSNPLGDDAADFPGDTYMRDFESSMREHVANALAVMDNNGVMGRVVDGKVVSRSITSSNEYEDTSFV